MLQVRGNGVVPRGQQAAYGDVQSHGGVGGKNHMVRPGAAQQPGRQAAGIIHRPQGGQGRPMSARAAFPALQMASATAWATWGGLCRDVAALSR